ncbi:hypothetical protein E6O75_ATG11076 [Venturia nashicola]|uniref:Uncharacterized protein n=1 Tax=Venturia nashicola TaxID=86259 RepID=A0A4Z1PJD1_9PEZI|nr:hypothetical protein E6O75_ATG11076 [Venturia nashicola]
MDFNDGSNGIGGWNNYAAELDFHNSMGTDWSDQELTSGFFPTDYQNFQSSSQPTSTQQVVSQQLHHGLPRPVYQPFSQPSFDREQPSIHSQAPLPTTPISTQSRLLTPISPPRSGCCDVEEFSLDPIAVSYSGFCSARDPRPIVSHLATPSTSQPFEFTGIGDPTSRFDPSCHSPPLSPDYSFNSSPVSSYFNDSSPASSYFNNSSPASSYFNSSSPASSYFNNSSPASSYFNNSSPASSYFNNYSYSEDLNSPLLPYPFLNPLQLQLSLRSLSASNMGQESSQMAPSTAKNPGASFKARPRVEQSPAPRTQSGRFTAINNPSSLQHPTPVELTYSGRDKRKTKRKRVKEATNSSRPPLPAKATRSPPQQVQSPSPSPSAVSVESPVIEPSPQAIPRAQTPRSDDSNNTALSLMSSQDSVIEESEPERHSDVEVTPAPKRRKVSRTPTTPVATGRRAPISGGRSRASASESPRSRASPARPKPVRRPTVGQQMNTGRYTGAELGLLTDAVHAWRDDNNLTQVEMNDLVNNNARTNDFPGGLWDFICGALPDRERHSVQKAVKRKFNNRKRGTWTPEDDEELCELYEMYKNQWQRIGEENNRGAEASRDRWRNYCKNGKAQQSGEWTPAEEKRLAQLMRDTVQDLVDQRIKDIKAGKSVPNHFEPEELMDFGILSEKMGGTRSRLQCRNKFEKFKSRQSQHLEYVRQPKDFLDGLEFEATTQEAGRKSKTKSRMSSARLSEEAEALHNYNERMLIGDKYHVLLSIQRALEKMPDDTDEESIPWDDIVERDNVTNWSILDRKTVLRQMQILHPVPDDQTCFEVIQGITDILETDYDDEELEQFYVHRPRSTKKQRTYTRKGSRAHNSISAIKVSAENDDDSPARSLPTPGSMEDDDDEEEGV